MMMVGADQESSAMNLEEKYKISDSKLGLNDSVEEQEKQCRIDASIKQVQRFEKLIVDIINSVGKHNGYIATVNNNDHDHYIKYSDQNEGRYLIFSNNGLEDIKSNLRTIIYDYCLLNSLNSVKSKELGKLIEVGESSYYVVKVMSEYENKCDNRFIELIDNESEFIFNKLSKDIFKHQQLDNNGLPSIEKLICEELDNSKSEDPKLFRVCKLGSAHIKDQTLIDTIKANANPNEKIGGIMECLSADYTSLEKQEIYTLGQCRYDLPSSIIKDIPDKTQDYPVTLLSTQTYTSCNFPEEKDNKEHKFVFVLEKQILINTQWTEKEKFDFITSELKKLETQRNDFGREIDAIRQLSQYSSKYSNILKKLTSGNSAALKIKVPNNDNNKQELNIHFIDIDKKNNVSTNINYRVDYILNTKSDVKEALNHYIYETIDEVIDEEYKENTDQATKKLITDNIMHLIPELNVKPKILDEEKYAGERNKIEEKVADNTGIILSNNHARTINNSLVDYQVYVEHEDGIQSLDKHLVLDLAAYIREAITICLPSHMENISLIKEQNEMYEKELVDNSFALDLNELNSPISEQMIKEKEQILSDCSKGYAFIYDFTWLHKGKKINVSLLVKRESYGQYFD